MNSGRLSLFANIQVIIGLISIVIGLLLVFAPPTNFFAAYNASIADAFWSGP